MVSLSIENEVLRSYLFFSSILVLKMLFMSALTAFTRVKYRVFANPEDSKIYKAKPTTDDRVERIRRAHLNDVENITLFFVAAFFYTLTNPTVFIAKTLFLTYTVARIVHTIVYAVVPLPQPIRGLSWFLGFLITGYMAINTLMYFMV